MKDEYNRFDSVFEIFAKLKVLGLLGAVLLVSACSAPPPGQDVYDPYEAANRSTHAVNKSLDKTLLRPAATGYSTVIPDPVQMVATNVSRNLQAPKNIVNNILQLDLESAAQNFAGFAVNTTVGVFGIADAATALGMTTSETGFDETLYKWGVYEGPYTELPVFGPATQRASVGLVVDEVLNPVSYVLTDKQNLARYALRISDYIKRRADFKAEVDSILYESVDSYAQSRILYLQNSRFNLGDTSQDVYIDPYEDFQ